MKTIDAGQKAADLSEKNQAAQADPEAAALLKGFLRRLDAGEDIRKVRLDFADAFQDAERVLRAEQALLKDGMPLAEVQKLCEVHCVLFRGGQTANAGGDAALLRERRAEKTRELSAVPGHPLRSFKRENDAIKEMLAQARTALPEDGFPEELRRGLAVHDAKKGDLLYPPLKAGYGISGPSDVMWTTDDEILSELSALAKLPERDEAWGKRMDAVLRRAEAMTCQEERVLFPNCALNFTEEEWKGIYRDAKDYPSFPGLQAETWEPGESMPAGKTEQTAEGEIVLPGGRLSVPQLRAILNTIPMEITFIDDRNINRFFNEGPKDFKRPGMAIGREVFSCHPPKVEMQVRQVLEMLRSGERDEVPVWTEKNRKTVLVRYMAVRDADGAYLGTMELVQNMDFAKKHFSGTGEFSPEK